MTAAGGASPPEGKSSAERFAASVDHLRSTAKWALVAYAAVGATLIAGSQLSSIGAFSWDDPRLWLAIGSVAVALGSVAYAVYFVVAVQTAGQASLSALATEEGQQEQDGKGSVHSIGVENPAVLAGYANVRSLRDDYLGFIDDQYNYGRINKNPELAKVSAAWVEYLGAVVGQLLALARYEDVDRAFSSDLRRKLLASSLIAGLAIGIFAWAANPKEPPASSEPFRVPTRALLILSPERREQLAPALGTGICVLPPVGVIVLAASEASADVVTEPHPGCRVARLTVERSELAAR